MCLYLPTPSAVFQNPSPAFTPWAFAVDLMASESGAALGSCFTTAARYWSITPSRQARLQLSEIGPIEARTRSGDTAITAASNAVAATRTERDRIDSLPYMPVAAG